jgi:hypothetical protein
MSAREEIESSGERRRADYRPEGTDARSSLFATVKRTFTEFSEDNMTDWAAALTYYGLLSLFPALIALVAILGLFGDPATTTKTVTEIVTKLGPSSAADTFARSSRSPRIRVRPGSCSSSGWLRRCGRHQATSARSCARPT